MNTHLILRHLLIAVLFITVGACSFQKNPKSTSDEATVEILQTQKTAPLDLEAIVSQKDSQKAIEDLSKIKIEDIDGKHTVDGTLLDTAIRLEKVDLIHYLVLRGANPFVISDASYKTMEHNQKINDVMNSLDKDLFFNILRIFPGEGWLDEAYSEYDQAIKNNHLGLTGCLKYVDFLMNIKYFRRDPIGSGLYYQGAFTKNAELAAFRTLTKGECSQYKDQFNLTKVSEWISNEIIHQFYNDFKSLKFINLLLTFPKERFLKIKITNSSDESLPRQLRLDPLLLVMIKKPCLPEEEFDKLYQTFTGLERGGYNYSDSFEYKTEDEIEKCYQEKKGEVCNPADNASAMLNIFRNLISNDEKESEKYNRYIYDLDQPDDHLKPESFEIRKNIKSVVCKKAAGEENE